MRVVQCYQSILDYCEGEPVRFEKYPFHEFCLIASALSWKRFAPEFERVFYVDQSIFEYLKRKGIEHLWDTVKVVDFPKRAGGSYFLCKEYCYMFQEQPFWISDVDIVLTRPVNEWFNSNLNYIPFYKGLNLSGEKEAYEALTRDYPNILNRIDPSRSGCAGLVFFRDGKQAQTLGKNIIEDTLWYLQEAKEHGPNREKYRDLFIGLMEEAAIVKYLEDVCGEKVDYYTLYQNTHIHTFLGNAGRKIDERYLKVIEDIQKLLDCNIVQDFKVNISELKSSLPKSRVVKNLV